MTLWANRYGRGGYINWEKFVCDTTSRSLLLSHDCRSMQTQCVFRSPTYFIGKLVDLPFYELCISSAYNLFLKWSHKSDTKFARTTQLAFEFSSFESTGFSWRPRRSHGTAIDWRLGIAPTWSAASCGIGVGA
jgi:hypothetical protein